MNFFSFKFFLVSFFFVGFFAPNKCGNVLLGKRSILNSRTSTLLEFEKYKNHIKVIGKDYMVQEDDKVIFTKKVFQSFSDELSEKDKFILKIAYILFDDDKMSPYLNIENMTHVFTLEEIISIVGKERVE